MATRWSGAEILRWDGAVPLKVGHERIVFIDPRPAWAYLRAS